jgi:hypothetical protein
MSGADRDAVLASPGGRGLLPEAGARAGPVGPVDMLATRPNSAFGKPSRRALEQNTRKVAAAANVALAAASGVAPRAPAAAAIAHELVHHARSTIRRAHEQCQQSGALKSDMLPAPSGATPWSCNICAANGRATRAPRARTLAFEGPRARTNRATGNGAASAICSSSSGGEASAGGGVC